MRNPFRRKNTFQKAYDNAKEQFVDEPIKSSAYSSVALYFGLRSAKITLRGAGVVANNGVTFCKFMGSNFKKAWTICEYKLSKKDQE